MAGFSTFGTHKDQFSWSTHISLHNGHAELHLSVAARTSAGLPPLPLWVTHLKTNIWPAFFSSFTHQSLLFSCDMCPLEFAVHKGISTYDYVKMKRQKDARNQDTEAASTHNGKTNNNATQVRPVFCLLLAVTSSCWRVFKTFTFSFNRIQTAQLTVSQHYRRVQGWPDLLPFLNMII